MANHLAACRKALKDWRGGWAKITGDETKKAAVSGLSELWEDMQTAVPVVTVTASQSGDSGEIITRQLAPNATTVITPVEDAAGVVRPVGANMPDEALINVWGYCPNMRLLRGELPDGRAVSVWRGHRNWRLPSKILCKRDAGSAGVYSPV